VLDFQVFGQSRQVMEWAHVVHSVAALGLIAASFGHMYLGSVGMEGAFDSISNGYVDANWAKDHHDLWYREMEQKGLVGVEPNGRKEVDRQDDVEMHGHV
jgi:formate dehydrogenase subunit gamma